MTKYKNIDISSVVQIKDWADLEDVLAGSRVKTTVSNPEDYKQDKDRLYIFKQPKPLREAQIWSELIASFIAGDLLDWPVQHAQIAMRGDQVGNLLGYIYDDQVDSFLSGEQFCMHLDSDFDPEQGTRHTWTLVKRILDELLVTNQKIEVQTVIRNMYKQFWTRTIAFDTLISNTDRHAENWGLVLRRPDKAGMAPFFDNASSMGCEIDERSLQRKWFAGDGRVIASKVRAYTASGRHHLRDGDNRFGFESLARAVLNDFPDMRSELESVANLKLEPIEQLMGEIMSMKNLPSNAQLTKQRACQIMTLLHEGRARVRRCLEEN